MATACHYGTAAPLQRYGWPMGFPRLVQPDLDVGLDGSIGVALCLHPTVCGQELPAHSGRRQMRLHRVSTRTTIGWMTDHFQVRSWFSASLHDFMLLAPSEPWMVLRLDPLQVAARRSLRTFMRGPLGELLKDMFRPHNFLPVDAILLDISQLPTATDCLAGAPAKAMAAADVRESNLAARKGRYQLCAAPLPPRLAGFAVSCCQGGVAQLPSH